MTRVVSERLNEELIRGGEFLLAVAEQDAGTVSNGTPRGLGNEGGLPLSGFTGDQDDLPSFARRDTLCRIRQRDSSGSLPTTFALTRFRVPSRLGSGIAGSTVSTGAHRILHGTGPGIRIP